MSQSCPLNVLSEAIKDSCAVAVLYLVTQSCLTLCNSMDGSPPGSPFHGDSLGKNAGVGCHALLHGIFPTQGSNLGLLHCRWILYCPRILYTREAHKRLLIVPYLLWPWLLAFLLTWCHWGFCLHAAVCCPHWGRPKSSRAALGADSCGWPPSRSGGKTTTYLQGQRN